ncbi:uncharacterized protein LOC128300503 [Anopheles moucheti]|uniref:uncharacterized protein LOC128300503 n=1 Tax=Anopheles moucheti TaxID=186751 RepID=UPI0022F0E681|nr:uncharacterized protein LOC128300503 [Anopheles moucheti]
MNIILVLLYKLRFNSTNPWTKTSTLHLTDKMEGLYSELRLMSFVLPKKSMYTEQFKLTLTRATELGIIRRLLKTYNNEMPTCQEGSLVHPVVLRGVAIPFLVLAGGFAAAIVILVLEKAFYSMQTMGILS